MANNLNLASVEAPAAHLVRVQVSAASTSSRIPAFDFTKGALVLFMVVYHWLNYFVRSFGVYYNYLHFLTPSFIFITGFLISHVHFKKYGLGSSQLASRLAIRGLKILALFIMVNALMAFLLTNSSVSRALGGGSLPATLYMIFVSGDTLIDGIGKAAVFGILVPISYLLIGSAGLLMAYRFSRYVFHIACAVLLLRLAYLATGGIQAENLELLMIGLLGVVLGSTSQAQIGSIVSHPLPVIITYGLYLTAVTIWGVPLPIRIISVILTTIVLYLAGIKAVRCGQPYDLVVLLGKYSLFGYLAQIAILQVLRACFSMSHLSSFGLLLLSLSLGVGLTVGSVKLLDWLRPRVIAIDWAYKVIFA